MFLDSFELGYIDFKHTMSLFHISIALYNPTFTSLYFFILIKSIKFNIPSCSFVLFDNITHRNLRIVIFQHRVRINEYRV